LLGVLLKDLEIACNIPPLEKAQYIKVQSKADANQSMTAHYITV